MEVRENNSELSEQTIAYALDLRDLSELKLPQIEAATKLLDQLTPSDGTYNLLKNGFSRLSSRYARLNAPTTLSKQFEQWYDKAVYSSFFAFPATILWGYQTLLRWWKKSANEAFPEGYWQFYVNYALRDDTARHTNETRGFDKLLQKHRIDLDPIDRLTAWVMAAIYCLHTYDDLLHNEWRERVYIHTLQKLATEYKGYSHFGRLYRQWERQRPYRRGPDVHPKQSYTAYRRHKFDEFLTKPLEMLPENLRRAWLREVHQAKERDLAQYQRQMSILAYLQSDLYSEKRIPISLAEAHIGLVYQGQYYLLPACRPNTNKPADVLTVRAQIGHILHHEQHALLSANLRYWAQVQRTYIPALRQKMRSTLLAELDALRYAPILLNIDPHQPAQALSTLRQSERGTGTQAMTIFDTGQTFVFDQSHIFFDGTWGVALAEIMTNEAIAWGVYLNTLPKIDRAAPKPRRLSIALDQQEQQALAKAPKATEEVSAETEAINLRNLLALRRIFKLRNDLIQLTVNDLLVLYRAIHAFAYRPNRYLLEELHILQQKAEGRVAAEQALAALDPQQVINPTILIPVDASQQNPHDRLHPITFQVPIHELQIMELHQRVLKAFNEYKAAAGFNRDSAYQRFDELQRTYLATLAGCGAVFSWAKAIAAQGESDSVSTMKLLAHLPTPLQHLLDKIPSRFELLNDWIKGREVFSNIGAVVPNSSLTRFMSAKDDNTDKTLAWGVLTNTDNVMHITLRDFRPHVQSLLAVGRADLANWIVQDYLDTYAKGLNDYIHQLYHITVSHRETRRAADIGKLNV